MVGISPAQIKASTSLWRS